MLKKIKEDDFGMLEWVSTGEGSGYWCRIEDQDVAQHRVPERCPACLQGLDNWAIEKFFHRNGVCADCSILYIEQRKFPEGFFKTRNDKVVYCKQKIAEKTQNQ